MNAHGTVPRIHKRALAHLELETQLFMTYLHNVNAGI